MRPKNRLLIVGLLLQHLILQAQNKDSLISAWEQAVILDLRVQLKLARSAYIMESLQQEIIVWKMAHEMGDLYDDIFKYFVDEHLEYFSSEGMFILSRKLHDNTMYWITSKDVLIFKFMGGTWQLRHHKKIEPSEIGEIKRRVILDDMNTCSGADAWNKIWFSTFNNGKFQVQFRPLVCENLSKLLEQLRAEQVKR
jgi:hypothetical protein